MSDRVVVIIPTYNEAEYIGRTLRSIVAQHADLEVVVVDRPGDDLTREIVLDIGRSEGLSVTILDDTEHTMSGARRLAVAYARQRLEPDFFLSMDADTVLPPTWVEKALRLARSEHYDLVAGEGYFEREFWRSVPRLAGLYARSVGSVFFPREIYELHAVEPPLLGSIFRRFGRPPSDCAMLVSAAAMAVTGDIPEDLDENGDVEQGVGWPLMVRLLDSGLTMASLKAPLYETSARRLIGDAVALIDSSTYAGVSTATFRDDSDFLRRALDQHADGLDLRALQEYVIRNYVILACILRPELVGDNADLFDSELSGVLTPAIDAVRSKGAHHVPARAFAAARSLTPGFIGPILAAFERERAS